MTRCLWLCVGMLGSAGIALGAVSAHGLEGLEENQFNAFETARVITSFMHSRPQFRSC